MGKTDTAFTTYKELRLLVNQRARMRPVMNALPNKKRLRYERYLADLNVKMINKKNAYDILLADLSTEEMDKLIQQVDAYHG